MSSSLLLTRRFAPLFWTQFFSAFSDNFLKNSLVFLILFHIGGSDAEALITLAAAVFIAPYFFLSALGGELADRYDKAVVARRLKFAEIGIAFIAVFGFAVHSVPVLFVALFLFGVIASLFGPIKYGILPDHHRHPAWDHRGRGRCQGRRRSLPFRVSHDRVLAHVLEREPADSAHRPR